MARHRHGTVEKLLSQLWPPRSLPGLQAFVQPTPWGNQRGPRCRRLQPQRRTANPRRAKGKGSARRKDPRKRLYRHRFQRSGVYRNSPTQIHWPSYRGTWSSSKVRGMCLGKRRRVPKLPQVAARRDRQHLRRNHRTTSGTSPGVHHCHYATKRTVR